jgi:hypothetical protein
MIEVTWRLSQGASRCWVWHNFYDATLIRCGKHSVWRHIERQSSILESILEQSNHLDTVHHHHQFHILVMCDMWYSGTRHLSMTQEGTITDVEKLRLLTLRLGFRSWDRENTPLPHHSHIKIIWPVSIDFFPLCSPLVHVKRTNHCFSRELSSAVQTSHNQCLLEFWRIYISQVFTPMAGVDLPFSATITQFKLFRIVGSGIWPYSSKTWFCLEGCSMQ